ncbi:DUF4185 domain-containing protein [Streptomyces sp. WMMC500]|uniref:DUF4185 domain-containing protein n=1 Tax=Streptomyces sp. WMMC500 TaxID=3015154 RepID=UPI00248C00E5|nr:DUF4185 domain-containing protein [Streptomyces sp. WMMC500]WBB61833.1 DUF4185 domain-containing protein [Streptomyces sp. WMMC500]
MATVLALLVAAVSPGAGTPTDAAASPADDWTHLFDRAGRSDTWLGADGIYSTPLNEAQSFGGADAASRTFFVFSDTILGSAEPSGALGNSAYQNHSSAVLTGDTPDPDRIGFRYGHKASGSTAQGDNLFGYTAWMQGALTVDDNVYVFGIPFDGDWKPRQVDLITVPVRGGAPDYAAFTRKAALPQMYHRNADHLYDYGIGVLNNSAEAGAPNPDGYLYLYGYRDALTGGQANRKDLIVSRVPRAEFPDLGGLRYWDGSGWSGAVEDSAPLVRDVSTEASVTPVTSGPHRGRYLAVYTRNVQSPDMMYALGDSPAGPFSEPVRFYTAPEFEGTGPGQRYTYNAKAHPSLSEPGELLVTYNVNRMGGAGNTNDYRPRFLRLDPDSLGSPADTARNATAAMPSAGG